MKIVLAVDGSKHGRWSMEWVSHMPLATRPKVVAVHALDLAALKAPFMMQPVVIGNEPYIRAEVARLEEPAKRGSAETKDFLPVGPRHAVEPPAFAEYRRTGWPSSEPLSETEKKGKKK